MPTKGRQIDRIGFEVKNLKAFVEKAEASGIDGPPAPRKVVGRKPGKVPHPAAARHKRGAKRGRKDRRRN